jgi:hypothetical protein
LGEQDNLDVGDMVKYKMCLRKTIKQLVFVILTSSILTACGGGTSSNTAVVLPLPPVLLTPEPKGQSVARMWNEVVLLAIRNDFARPTIHARNLFHISSAMFDAWSVYKPQSQGFLFGNEVAGFSCSASIIDIPEDVLPQQEQAISFAAYRIIQHRFIFSPGSV